jgi:hypothetical protein
VVLRHAGQEYALTALPTGMRAKATIGATAWTFASRSSTAEIAGLITATPDSFVLLEYPNPPGGIKYCLNTKLAAAEVSLHDRATGERTTLHSRHSALFELLDDVDPRTR